MSNQWYNQHHPSSQEEVRNLLRAGEVSDISELKPLGMSVRAIEAMTGHDRNTIRKYLGKEPGTAPTYGLRAPRPSKLDGYKPYLDERLQVGCGTRWCCCASCGNGAMAAATGF